MIERSFKTAHGTSLCATPAGLEHHHAPAAEYSAALAAILFEGFPADFEIIDLGQGEFALRRDGKFACAEPGTDTVAFDRSDIGPWEIFKAAEGDRPVPVRGRPFRLLPVAESDDFSVVSQLEFEETFPRIAATSDIDADWYESGTINFFQVKYGRHRDSNQVILADNKILSTKFKAHGTLIDERGFLTNYGFLFRRRGEFTRLSISPTDDTLHLDANDIVDNSQLKGRYLLPFDGNSFNYYHFVADGLIPLLMLRDAGLAYPPILCVGPGGMLPWQKQYFELLGERSVEVIYGELSEFVHVERLYYIKRAGIPHYPRRFVVDLAQKLKGSLDSTSALPMRARRIYVKRKPGQRYIKNQDQVETMLSDLGFEPIDLEDMPVATQVRYFANAEIIVGAHGAGMVNVIYSTRDTTLVDLMPGGGEVRNFFWVLCEKVGVRYRFVRCEAPNSYGGDLIVDVAGLRKVVLSISPAPS